MTNNIQEFIDTLFAPMPPAAASDYLALCKRAIEEIIGSTIDPDTHATEAPFDQLFLAACKLRRAQRWRLITSLVNHEVLLARFAKNSTHDDDVPKT